MTLLRAMLGRDTERRNFETSSIIPSVENYYGIRISQEAATRIITILRCNQILADSVSTLPVAAYTRQDRVRLPAPTPSWLETPVPEDPSITAVEHFSQAVWSYGLDGNIFTLALPSVYDPAALYVLDPRKVEIKKGPRYRITREGAATIECGPDQLIHITRHRLAGALRGLSPIDEAALTLGTQRQAQRFGDKVFANGVYMSGYVKLPGPAAPDVIDQLKEEIDEQYGGANQFKPGVFANNSSWEVPQLSLEQLQFLAFQKWGKEECANLYGIPPYMVGSTEPGAMAYASVDAMAVDMEKLTLRPILVKIEAGYRRLLPPGEFLRFDTKGWLRGDVKTRFEAYHLGLQDKIYDIDEVRSFEDEPPFGGERGGPLETPNNNPPMTGVQQA